MNLADITPLLLTYDEAANIERTLDALSWAGQIVVIDSGSTDGTGSLVARYGNAMLIQRPFDSHTAQWNFGLEQIEMPWVLTLDADYVCPDSLVDELRTLEPDRNAYQAQFRYCIEGQPLRGSLYPPRVVLFRADRFRYRQDGHTQMLHVGEPVGKLQSIIRHDDRKPLGRWLADQARYADQEVEKLLSASSEKLSWKDRLRKRILWAPLLTFFYCMFYRRLVLDGWPGIYYSLQRVYAEFLLSLKLLDARLRSRTKSLSVEPVSQPFPSVGGDSVADAPSKGSANRQSASETPPTLKSTTAIEQPR